jgi:UPF0489 domain
MCRMNKTGLFIVEEHHEAYCAWLYAIRKGIITGNDNCLVHVDEHSDMNPARFRAPFQQHSEGMQEIKSFTYRELCIDTFICTSIYSGIFNQVQWIRQRHQTSKTNQWMPMYVRSFNNARKKLVLGQKLDAATHERLPEETDIRYFSYLLGHIEDIRESGNTVLDIDLDFFSCTGHPNKQKPLLIETTVEEVERFNREPYHPMRFWFSRVEASQMGEKYYYIINNYEEIYPEETYVSLQAIDERIHSLIGSLERNKILPKAITVCRSRHSGFTPSDQWQYIETHLLEGLTSLYDLEEYSFECL